MRTDNRLSSHAILAFLLAVLGSGSALHAAPKKSAKPASVAPRSAAAPTRAAAAPAPAPATLLDTSVIRKLYLDGDFEEAIDKCESSLRYGKGHSHVDSVFLFKHLGVMYAAKYETREKGKYYMHQLLAVEPTARILDMYASDMIYMIFKNIKDEFDAARMKYDRADDLLTARPQPTPDTGGKKVPEKTSKDKGDKGDSGGNGALYWIGATGALVAAGVTAYFVFSDEPKTVVNDHTIE